MASICLKCDSRLRANSPCSSSVSPSVGMLFGEAVGLTVLLSSTRASSGRGMPTPVPINNGNGEVASEEDEEAEFSGKRNSAARVEDEDLDAAVVCAGCSRLSKIERQAGFTKW